MKKKAILAILLAVSLIFSGCASQGAAAAASGSTAAERLARFA